MASGNIIERPTSYEVTRFTAQHLRVLHTKFAELIQALEPAFQAAEINSASDPLFKANVFRSFELDRRYIAPADLLDWATRRNNQLRELAKKVERNETAIISGNDLQCLRQIRAFCITFRSITKRHYSNFNYSEKEIATTLSHGAIPRIENAGIFDLLNTTLKGEKADTKNDLGRIDEVMSVGKTLIKAVSALRKIRQQPKDLEPERIDETTKQETIEFLSALRQSVQTSLPKAEVKKAIFELPLNDPRQEKPKKTLEPTNPPKNWITKSIPNKTQPELNLG